MHNEILSFIQYMKDSEEDINSLDNKEIEKAWHDFQNLNTNTTNVSDWIEEWVDIFPRGVKNRSGKVLKQPALAVLKKMRNFVKLYKYDVATIFDATKAYIRNGEDNDFKYTRANIFFIDKQGEGSDLAAWCEKVLSGQLFLEELEEEEDYESDEFI